MADKKYEKKDYKKELDEITEKLETGIKELFESEKYKLYLQTMAKFHNYSVRNSLLIHLQMPNASRVASYKAWKEQFNRQVLKGQKAIKIFAPIQVKTNQYIERDKIDPKTKLPVLDENGEPVTEAVNLKELRFKLVPVFDVSQTEGEPLPQIAEALNGDVKNYELFIEALKSVSPFPVEFKKLPDELDGRCIFGDVRKIEIREGMSEVQTVSAAVHEITHAILHDKNSETVVDDKTRKTKEVEAESVSYAVCQYFGIETGANSFGYISSWSSGKELKELKESLDVIKNTSAQLINSVEAKFKELLEERETLQNEKAEEMTETVQEEHVENEANVKADTEAKNQDYIMPDNDITVKELNEYGYNYENMLPLTQNRALELFDFDNAIYIIYPDNTEGMVYEREEILNAKEPIFGIEKADWEVSKEYKDLKSQIENENRQESKDTFSIYQLKDDDELRNYRFASFDELKKDDLKVEANNYELVYKAPLNENDSLDSIYNKFNIDRPEDFIGHSLSVGDVIIFEKDGECSSHYVDRFGFKELPDFLRNEKFPSEFVNEEVKQDNGKTDVVDNAPTVAQLEAEVKTGNSISLLDLANAIQNEKPARRKKTSVISKLKENKKAISEKEKLPKEDKKINGRDL